jgi:hypothetical protein
LEISLAIMAMPAAMVTVGVTEKSGTAQENPQSPF